MRRDPIAPLDDMFQGRELIGEELLRAERGYSSEGLLEGAHFSYVYTLIPQLIDIMVSDFVLPAPPPEADPAQPSGSRGGTSQASQGHRSSRVASSNLMCFLAFTY